MQPSRRLLEWAFLGLFAVSGACGLIHEVVWVRRLTFVFGGTTLAITTVLACFMGGLSVGSWLAGRLSWRIHNPLRLYGLFEMGIGAFCLAVPLLLDLAAPAYAFLARLAGGSFPARVAARVAVSAAVLGVPACLMGATLPVLVEGFAARREQTGAIVARFYGINTLGAFAGCAAAGLWMLPAIGFLRTLVAGASLNVAAGAAALLLARRAASDRASSPAAAPGPDGGREDTAAETPSRLLPPSVLLASYAVAGFAAMACQVVWTRALVLVFGPSTYTFSLVAACFILGLGLGSLLIGPYAKRRPEPLRAVAILQAAIALSTVLVLPLFARLSALVLRLSRRPGLSFESLFGTEALAVFGLLLVPTLCMGATLPLICAAVAAARRAAGSAAATGSVYAANTLGSILGTCAAGFWLIPRIGNLQRTVLVFAALYGLLALFYGLAAPWRRPRLAWGALAALWIAGIAAASLQEPWSRMALACAPYLGRGVCPQETIVFHRDDVDASVTVSTLNRKDLVLRINGKPDASTETQDMYSQVLTGGIPMLLRPDSKTVFVLGLGAGVTPATVVAHGAERVDLAEISVAVVQAGTLFAAHNGDVLNDPRVRLIRDDGRNFLLLTDSRYDLIVCEPSNPWVSGLANLFSREFFEIARSRLNPGGLHGQWVHSYSMSPDDFASILATFSGVFPHVQVWSMSFGDYLLVGSDAPIVLSLPAMQKAFERPAVKAAYGSILISDFRQLAHHYVAEGAQLAAWFQGRRVLTDDVPHLEYSAPRHVLRNDSLSISRVLYGVPPVPPIAADADPAVRDEFLRRVVRARLARSRLADSVSAARDNDSRRFLDDLAAAATATPDDARVLLLVAQTLNAQQQASAPAGQRLILDYRRRIEQVAPLFRSL